jgi:hypothetical protein
MFNSQRFLRLANAHWTEYRKAYAWFIGIGIIVHFVLLLIMMSSANGFMGLSEDGQGVIYYSGLFLTAPIFAARYFQLMSKRKSALIILMRPASIFEKWLLAFIVVAILYSIVYTLAFYVCNTPAWLLASAQAKQYALLNPLADNDMSYKANLSARSYDLFFILNSLKSWKDFAQLFLILTTAQAFAVLGSLYFKSMPFIKTILFAFFILLISIFIATVLHSNPDGFFKLWSSNSLVYGPKQFVYLFAWLGIPILLWLSCFYALKEREVA